MYGSCHHLLSPPGDPDAMAARCRHGEDGISFEHRGPCRDPGPHRHCPGLWRGEITLGYTGDGKRTRRKVSGQTKAAIIDKLRDLHTELDKASPPRPATSTTPSGKPPRTGSRTGWTAAPPKRSPRTRTSWRRS